MDVDGALGNWIFNWELSHENVIARRRSALNGIRSDFSPHCVIAGIRMKVQSCSTLTEKEIIRDFQSFLQISLKTSTQTKAWRIASSPGYKSTNQSVSER